MEMAKIVYKGIEYPLATVKVSKIWDDVENDYVVNVADIELWNAIMEGYENEDPECVEIDNIIFYYCDSGFIDSNPDEEKIIEYLRERC